MRKSRRLLINPKFQLSFVAYLLLVSSCTTAVFWGAYLYFFWKFEGIAKTAGLPSDHLFFRFISDQRAMLFKVLFIAAVVVFLCVILSGLWISHRVAGPLERLKGHLQKVARGETTEDLRFRKADDFDDVAECINAALARLREPAKPTHD